MNWLKRLINPKTEEGVVAPPSSDVEMEFVESPIPSVKKEINRAHVLTEEEKVEVCRRWACYETKRDIVRWLEEERGKKVTWKNIHNQINREKWIPLIEQQRNQFIQGLVEEPLSNKRKRLQYLHRYMERAEEKGLYHISINAVDKARLEMEPKNDNFQIQLNQFNMISDEELKEIRNRLQEKLKGRKDAGSTGKAIEVSSSVEGA